MTSVYGHSTSTMTIVVWPERMYYALYMYYGYSACAMTIGHGLMFNEIQGGGSSGRRPWESRRGCEARVLHPLLGEQTASLEQ